MQQRAALEKGSSYPFPTATFEDGVAERNPLLDQDDDEDIDGTAEYGLPVMMRGRKPPKSNSKFQQQLTTDWNKRIMQRNPMWKQQADEVDEDYEEYESPSYFDVTKVDLGVMSSNSDIPAETIGDVPAELHAEEDVSATATATATTAASTAASRTSRERGTALLAELDSDYNKLRDRLLQFLEEEEESANIIDI